MQGVVDEAGRRRRLQIDFGREGTAHQGFLNERGGRIHDRRGSNCQEDVAARRLVTAREDSRIDGLTEPDDPWANQSIAVGATRRNHRQRNRFVLPPERTELARLKLDRSPWLRAEVSRQNWHFLKWSHLEALAARDGASLEWLEPVLGLDPLIERGGEQLTMFGE